MSEQVRQIHIPGTAAFESLRERVQIALTMWARQWIGDDEDDAQLLQTTIVVQPLGEEACGQAHSYESVRAEQGSMWFRRDDRDLATFATAVVGEEPVPSTLYVDAWIGEATNRARHARNHTLHAALLGASEEQQSSSSDDFLPGDLFRYGSGACEISCEALGLRAVVDSNVWRGIEKSSRRNARPLPKATPLDQAVRQASARLEVLLGEVEVELPKILDMRCGDVLRLPLRLDQGIPVTAQGLPLARAMLGEARGSKAIRVVAG